MSTPSAPKRPLRLTVLISGGGSTLANLIERIRDGSLRNVKIDRVISSRMDARGVEIARQAGLPIEVVPLRDFGDKEQFSGALTDACDMGDGDLVVMGGFLSFWDFPPRYENRVLNIHPALLPKHGGRGMFGLHVHRAVLAAGDSASGCTVHLVDHEYDHGPIVAQRRVLVEPDDTPESLAQRVNAAERELYPEVIQNVADNGVRWLEQFSAVGAAKRR